MELIVCILFTAKLTLLQAKGIGYIGNWETCIRYRSGDEDK